MTKWWCGVKRTWISCRGGKGSQQNRTYFAWGIDWELQSCSPWIPGRRRKKVAWAPQVREKRGDAVCFRAVGGLAAAACWASINTRIFNPRCLLCHTSQSQDYHFCET